MDTNQETIDPKTGKAPESRFKDAASLNSSVKKIIEDDLLSAQARVEIQRMLDGAPPYAEQLLKGSGQDGRCNLNFGDGKARLKAEMAGYYDLTDSVPVLATILPDAPAVEIQQRVEWGDTMAEEWHRELKDWADFDNVHQLLVQKMCSHGLGVLYHKDDIDWHWDAAGMEDFKFPRRSPMSAEKIPMAICTREVEVGELYTWIQDLPAKDKRWNEKEVETAILMAYSGQPFANDAWEKWQEMAKNNDLYMSSSANNCVKVVHVWVKEYSGKVSQYLTLRDGTNSDYLFKCPNRFDSVNQCYTVFAYEIGSNGFLHSVRGQGHEIYPQVQVLNSLRCQLVDNAKLSGSLLLQPKSAESAEDLAILYYNGAVYLPPNVEVANGQLNNPSQNILPVIQDMTMLMRRNTGDVPTNQPESERDKTKFEVQAELTRESVIPTASLNLFYQPWRRHLKEVYRRFSRKGVTENEPGGKEILAYRKRCMARGVPEAVLTADAQVEPMRAIGFGSPTNRLMALDEFMQYYGSLDPVGQNNLLRDRFAQKVGYAQVDRFVPKIEDNGRQPVDIEVAELQNVAMSAGTPTTVRPNDPHLIHMPIHLPSIQNDLTQIEGGNEDPNLLQVVQVKMDHITQHMQHVHPDKLTEKTVAQLSKDYNNTNERVQAAVMHAQRQAAKQQEEAAQAQPGGPPTKEQLQTQQKLQQNDAVHQQNMQQTQDMHDLKMKLSADESEQRRRQSDLNEAVRTSGLAAQQRVKQAAAAAKQSS